MIFMAYIVSLISGLTQVTVRVRLDRGLACLKRFRISLPMSEHLFRISFRFLLCLRFTSSIIIFHLGSRFQLFPQFDSSNNSYTFNQNAQMNAGLLTAHCTCNRIEITPSITFLEIKSVLGRILLSADTVDLAV